MDYQATSKYIRTSTRKLRLVADAIRKLTPAQAQLELSRMPKRAADPMGKVLLSAITNAKVSNVPVEELRFKCIEVMGGPVMKRWMAVSRGQGHAFKKRMTHVRIVVSSKDVKIAKNLPSGGNHGTKS